MPIKVGNSYVSEAAYAYAKSAAAQAEKSGNTDVLASLKEKYPSMKFSTNTQPFSGDGTNNMAIAPNILRQMQSDPEKRLEYEALIYDCNELQRSAANRFSMNGSKLVSQGFIIDAKGNLSGWCVATFGGSEKKSSCALPKDDKKTWMERLLESAKKENSKDEAAKRSSWRA